MCIKYLFEIPNSFEFVFQHNLFLKIQINIHMYKYMS